MQPSTGYFQRLSQRSGVVGDGRPQAAPKPSAHAAAGSIEVDEVREVAQPVGATPAAAPAPLPQPQVPSEKREPPATFAAAPAPTADTPDQRAPSAPADALPTVQPTAAQLTRADHQAPENSPANEDARPQPQPAELSETPDQPPRAIEKDILIPVPVTAEVPDTDSAPPPSFIREKIAVPTEVPPPLARDNSIAPAPQAAMFVREAAAPVAPVLQVELPPEQPTAPVRPVQDNSARVQIGQISIEVHSPVSAPTTQVVERPQTPPPARTRPPKTERPVNLQRYYLRGS